MQIKKVPKVDVVASLISFNEPIDSGSIIKPCTLKLFQVPILASGLKFVHIWRYEIPYHFE